jgi:hypothetical protein
MPAVTVHDVGDVIESAAAKLNDTQQAIWTDARLMPHVKAAVNWLASQIANISTQYFEKVAGQPYSSDIVYAGGTVDLTLSLPADLYEPESLEYRLTAAEEWSPMERTSALPSQVTSQPGVLTTWEWSGRTLRVNPCTANALIRLRYLALMPDVDDVGNPIPIDNCVQALAFATAANAYAARGQATQAAAMWGKEGDPPSGACMYLGLVLGIIVKNEQLLPRRAAPFSSGTFGSQYGWPRP